MYGPKPRPVAERLEEKIAYEPASGCWLWLGAVNHAGYGLINVNNRSRLAHRESYKLRYGPVPDGQSICHRCDTPACVKPDHLFPGDPAVNAADKVAKGRQPRGLSHSLRCLPTRGENHHAAKLTDAQVGEIRAAKARNECTQKVLAARYGVSIAQISRIVHGKRGGFQSPYR